MTTKHDRRFLPPALIGAGAVLAAAMPSAVPGTAFAQAQANPCQAAAITTQAANPFDVAAGLTQAVYGDAMPDVVKNYLRAAPYVGTGGVVGENGFAEIARLHFKTIINLNTAEEGADNEAELTTAAGLRYVNIPVSSKAPTAEQVAEFAVHVNDPANYPVLVHCQSSNRVGAMWALYRAAHGVPPEIAIQEGRTVGLKPGREEAVRDRLGLPPPDG